MTLKKRHINVIQRALLIGLISFLCLPLDHAFAQGVPSREENIPFLITFGKNGSKSWGDDDNKQVFYFIVPKKFNKPFYIRVFDPDVGGLNDEQKQEFDSKTKFTVFGGKGCVSNDEIRKDNPEGDYKTGTQLSVKVFGEDEKYDNKWYSFGPFDPASGELMNEYGGYVFKISCEGISGDDGNLYKYHLSTSKDKNVDIEGGNAFTFEYAFRLNADVNQTSHIYPYIDNKVVSMQQSNFDWDSDGTIRLISKSHKGELLKTSGDNHWANSKIIIKPEDRNSSADIQFIKDKTKNIRNNNVVFNVTNQYGKYLPFYSIPIGGVPKYAYQIATK